MAIDRERVLAAAQKYVEKKRYDRAAVEYQRVLQEDPNDARILLKLGDLQSKMGSYPEAIATYERVGKFYATQGFSLKAIAVFKQIREIISRYAPALDDKYAHIGPKLAELYQQLGLTSDALAALDEVATRLQRQNRDSEAVDVFRKLVELDPTNPLPHLRLAEALSRNKDVDGAVAEFGAASGQLVKLGRRDDALKVIDRLLQHRPDPTYARIAAELLLARGAPNDGMLALAKLQVSFQANQRDLDTLGLLARAFTDIGQGAKAIEVQKEMARIARDSGQTDLFRRLVNGLVELAPADEEVLRLANSVAPTSLAPPTGQTDVDGVEADEDITDNEIEPASQLEATEVSKRLRGDGLAFVDRGEQVMEVGAETFGQNRERVARVLSEAASYRRAGQLALAIESLHDGLRAVPKALEVHEMLRDVLLDAGQTEEAVAEMIRLAEILVETLDGESAARCLQDALAIDPQNEIATGMLADLGYELVEEPEAEATEVPEEPARPHPPSQDPDAPLPSYDLEEIGPDDVARSPLDARSDAETQAGRNAFATVDDPFASGPTARTRSRPASVPELESALEEAEFFSSRGLFDDARAIVEEQLVRLPNHPLLLDRLAELDAQRRSRLGESGTRKSSSFSNDESFDIADSLNSLEMQRVKEAGTASAEQVDVEQVFAQFKAGVASQIGADDAQSHYDLGVAYKEMGLIDDAVREFGVAARDAKQACVCQSMIGMLEMERGRINEAIEALSRGLQAEGRTKEQDASLHYEMGAAYEAKKLTKLALEHFQRTARIAPAFRDVQERVRKLQRAEVRTPSSRVAAIGADDEFDRAFDDAFSHHSNLK